MDSGFRFRIQDDVRDQICFVVVLHFDFCLSAVAVTTDVSDAKITTFLHINRHTTTFRASQYLTKKSWKKAHPPHGRPF